MGTYTPPVDKLLTLGETGNETEWRDYRELGIGTEDIPELIRLALDADLRWADSASDAVWACVHAWRALGELRAQAAIEPLLGLFRDIDEYGDDWVTEELPEVYGMIGPAAIPALAGYLADPSHRLYARVGASDALGEIGKRHPESRADAIAALTRQLDQFSQNDPTLNGFLLSQLLNLHAVEAAPVIEHAFASDAIDENIAGDWEDVQVEFGMKEKRTTPRPRSPLAQLFDPLGSKRSTPPPWPNRQVDAVIAKMRAEGVLKAETSPKREKKKKKHHHKKR